MLQAGPPMGKVTYVTQLICIYFLYTNFDERRGGMFFNIWTLTTCDKNEESAYERMLYPMNFDLQMSSHLTFSCLDSWRITIDLPQLEDIS